MQNLGYWQMTAGPGVWNVQLAGGRSSKLYEMLTGGESAGGSAGFSYYGAADSSTMTATPSKQFVVRDFTGSVHQLNVRKKEGMEKTALLTSGEGDETGQGDADDEEEEEEEEAGNGLGSVFAQMFGMTGKKGKQVVLKSPKHNGDKLHVFSLATGASYERMLKIMMASVSKRASVPVKFWLLENFLSPQFKREVPYLQTHFGYEIELVTYKWPVWLRQQTEKQRIIWGYKILFLDVLFPLDVTKIIYVDADQVVRADLKELWDMDLKGAAYGYTPFCTSRKETLGFQFWQEGYWKTHLRGRPYHISALYVVDLTVFRKRAIGDKLRGV
jgi:UDP-glucose:glycoprotein glucosyltransferase